MKRADNPDSVNGKSWVEAVIYQSSSNGIGLNYKTPAIATFYTRYVRY